MANEKDNSIAKKLSMYYDLRHKNFSFDRDFLHVYDKFESSIRNQNNKIDFSKNMQSPYKSYLYILLVTRKVLFYNKVEYIESQGSDSNKMFIYDY